MEFVAKPIPNAMADSTPRKLAVNFSRTSCLSRLPNNRRTNQPLRRPSHLLTAGVANLPLGATSSITNFLPGARHADAVFAGDLGHRVSAGSGVLGKAEVIVRAEVNHVAHHLVRVPAEGGDRRA